MDLQSRLPRPGTRAAAVAAAPATARAPGAQGPQAPSQPGVMATLRSPGYLRLLAQAAILGVPISAAAFGFLALVSYLQKEIFTYLPHRLGFAAEPVWWPLPVLAVGGVLAGLAIRYLPGDGGPSPAGGFAIHAAPSPAQLPGVICAALATLVFGAVVGPDMPLIALGGGLAVLATRLPRREMPAPRVKLLGSAGSFAAIGLLLGSPLLAAFLLMEASGLGGPMMGMMLVPGLLTAGIGSLIFIGLGRLSGLGTFSLAIPGLPHFARPDLAEFGWAIVIGLAAAVLGPAISWLGRYVRSYAQRRTMIVVPLAGVAVAALAIIYAELTSKGSSQVLFSGQNDIGPLIQHAAGYSVGALVVLLVCKGLAYAVSLGSFRGGPVFPAMFLGTAGGIALSHLPGLPLVAGIAMGIGAMAVVMLTLPLTAVLLATLLLASDGVAVMPLVIVTVVVAYVAAARIAPRLDAEATPSTRNLKVGRAGQPTMQEDQC
jgi:H+/Cl- antiporter ClcA